MIDLTCISLKSTDKEIMVRASHPLYKMTKTKLYIAKKSPAEFCDFFIYFFFLKKEKRPMEYISSLDNRKYIFT